MDFEYALITNCGDRKVNEDTAKVFEGNGCACFVVCDGLGGHGMGDVASALVADVFGNMFSLYAEADADSFLEKAFNASQDILLAKQKSDGVLNKMKTTAAAVMINDKNVYIGHIGDSRVYVFKDNAVSFQTLDHSFSQMLVFTDEISSDEIRNHPDRNILLKALGNERENDMFEFQLPISTDDCQALLLCSDGFWELINEEEMGNCLASCTDADSWLQSMTQIVRKNGENRNMDNYSAIAIFLK